MIRIAAGLTLLGWAYVMGFGAWPPFGPAMVATLLAAGALAIVFIGHRWRSASVSGDAKGMRHHEVAMQVGKAAFIWVVGYSLFWIGVIAGFDVGI
tara:strand:+ start:927 stop:1214 length:288 start_codon:yes stop_codon:yes gene_type:complete